MEMHSLWLSPDVQRPMGIAVDSTSMAQQLGEIAMHVLVGGAASTCAWATLFHVDVGRAHLVGGRSTHLPWSAAPLKTDFVV